MYLCIALLVWLRESIFYVHMHTRSDGDRTCDSGHSMHLKFIWCNKIIKCHRMHIIIITIIYLVHRFHFQVRYIYTNRYIKIRKFQLSSEFYLDFGVNKLMNVLNADIYLSI